MIAFDSNVLIYFLEKNTQYFDAAARLLLPALTGDKAACTSVLTITEIVAGSSVDVDLEILRHPNIYLQPIDADVARTAGVLRLSHKIKTPDALHMSAALQAGADAFVTNDAALFRLRIPGLKIRPL